jgi:hypothetical protein
MRGSRPAVHDGRLVPRESTVGASALVRKTLLAAMFAMFLGPAERTEAHPRQPMLNMIVISTIGRAYQATGRLVYRERHKRGVKPRLTTVEGAGTLA